VSHNARAEEPVRVARNAGRRRVPAGRRRSRWAFAPRRPRPSPFGSWGTGWWSWRPVLWGARSGRSGISWAARDRSLFVSRAVWGRVEAAPWARGVAWCSGPGVTAPKCRCSGFSRPRWI